MPRIYEWVPTTRKFEVVTLDLMCLFFLDYTHKVDVDMITHL